MADTVKPTEQALIVVPQQQPVLSAQQAQQLLQPAAKPEKKGYRGQVKSVPSGDSLVVSEFDHEGKSTDHTVSIAGLSAPRLGRLPGELSSGEATADEPWAWDSREFLRKKCIGQMVSCTINHVTANKREFATVLVNGEDISKAIVAEGWASVRAPNLPANAAPRPEVTALLELEEQAKQAKKGVHNTAGAEGSKRPLTAQLTPLAFFERENGKDVKAIVEMVRSGTTIRVTLLPSFLSATINIAGAASPVVRWNQQKQELEAEPFGMEARHFVEHHVLNREVTVHLKSIDKQNSFTAVVTVLGRDLAEELIKIGMAKFVPWAGVKDMPDYCQKLKNAESIAVSKLAGIWSSGKHLAPSPNDPVPPVFKAQILDIPTSGTIVVKTEAGASTRVTFASIRVPRIVRDKVEKKMERKVAYDRQLVMEGRELLRKKLIGQIVECHMRYERSGQVGEGESAQATDARSFYDVYFEGKNVALALLDAGLAEAVQHRANEPRSDDYDALVLAEKRAQAKLLGVFKPLEKVELARITDFTIDQTQSRSAPLMQSFRAPAGTDAIVEHVFSPTHLKLFVKQINGFVSLCLVAARSPKPTDKFGGKFSDEAMAFVKETCMLRNVRFTVENVDKRGNFIGTIMLDSKRNLGHILVANGYASVSEMDDRSPSYEELAKLQESARSRKLRIWENYVPPVIELPGAGDKPKEVTEVVVTEIVSPSQFFVQFVKEGVALEELGVRLGSIAVTPQHQQLQRMMKFVRGMLVIAKWQGAWFRARVTEDAETSAVVNFIDYGNSDRVDKKLIMPLPDDLVKLAPFAKKCTLAFVGVPDLDSDLQAQAAEEFAAMVDGKKLTATIEGVEEKGVLSLSLTDGDVHVNTALVRDGLARVRRSKLKIEPSQLATLKDAEGKAKANRMNMWQYGDYGSDED